MPICSKRRLFSNKSAGQTKIEIDLGLDCTVSVKVAHWSFIKSQFIFLTGKPTVPLLFQVCKTIPRCNSVPRKACKKIPRQHCQNLPKSKEAVKLYIFLKSNGISKQMVGTNHERPETKYLIWLPPQCFKVPRKTCKEFPRKKCKVSFHSRSQRPLLWWNSFY